MHEIILDKIPFNLDTASLMANLRIRPGSSHVRDLERLIVEGQAIAKPKALYKIAYVDARGEDFVTLDGVRLTSRVLRINLDNAHRLFAYLVTCGTELERWAESMSDLLHRFWAGAIQETALLTAHAALEQHLAEMYQPGLLSMMNPGSLEDWPLPQQQILFEILGDTRELIGVHLTESCLMIPAKSVSGLLFPTEENFESCQLCPRDNCSGRRSPYDESLLHGKYAYP